MPRWLWIFLAVAVAVLVWFGQVPAAPPVATLGGTALDCPRPPSVTPGREPLQSPVPREVLPFQLGDYQVTPLAGFSIEARVLSREDYHFGTEAELSPTDLALGWQRMADPAHYEPLDISQSGRWYRYSWGSEGPPLPEDEIVASSANMHLIPANAAVAQALADVEPGSSVRIEGWLVEVRRSDGWHWRSSLTRRDSGAGACELVYVCALSSASAALSHSRMAGNPKIASR